MPKITIGLAIILILLGLAGYLGTGMASFTALIPAFFGIVFLIFGLLGLKENMLKHAMHGAALFSLIGLAGSGMGLAKLPALLAGEAERPVAVILQSVMAVLMVLFIGLCIKSFIDARKLREST
ncbi:MAG: hypothetical protein AAGA18_06655 [Verrucomicrobiota bacterium]